MPADMDLMSLIARQIVPKEESFLPYTEELEKIVTDPEEFSPAFSELYMLVSYAVDFAICLSMPGDPKPMLDKYYEALANFNKQICQKCLNRRPLYVEAVKNPHPEYGLSYVVAKTYCKICNNPDRVHSRKVGR